MSVRAKRVTFAKYNLKNGILRKGNNYYTYLKIDMEIFKYIITKQCR